jgi:hypothetical protein
MNSLFFSPLQEKYQESNESGHVKDLQQNATYSMEIFVVVIAVLGFELRAYSLYHSTSSFL